MAAVVNEAAEFDEVVEVVEQNNVEKLPRNSKIIPQPPEFACRRKVARGFVDSVSASAGFIEKIGLIRGCQHRLLRTMSRAIGVVQSSVKGVKFSTTQIAQVDVKIYWPTAVLPNPPPPPLLKKKKKKKNSNKRSWFFTDFFNLKKFRRENKKKSTGKYSISMIGDLSGDAAAKMGCLVFFHGGGFSFSSARSYHSVTAELCRDVGCVVVSVDYRLAPKHGFPDGLDDCFAVTRAILDDALIPELEGCVDRNRLVLAGDDAGANFAISVALELARCAQPARRRLHGILAICPPLQAVTCTKLESFKSSKNPKNSKFYFKNEMSIPFYAGIEKITPKIRQQILKDEHLPRDVYLNLLSLFLPDLIDENCPLPGSENDSEKTGQRQEIVDLVSNRRAWPLLAEDEDLKQLPPLMIQACDNDVLLSENELFARKLARIFEEDDTHVRFSCLSRALRCESMFRRPFKSQAARCGYQAVVDYLKESFQRQPVAAVGDLEDSEVEISLVGETVARILA